MNLLTEHPFDFVITAAEFNGEGFDRVSEFRAQEAFSRREVSPERLLSGVLLDEDEFQVEGVVVDHGIPCLAFAFEEKLRVNVWSEGLSLLCRGSTKPSEPCDGADDLSEIVYLDQFGNAMTGLRAAMLPRNARLVAGGRVLKRARTFRDRQPGTAFWYENPNGLAEIAVNQGRADRELGLSLGS